MSLFVFKGILNQVVVSKTYFLRKKSIDMVSADSPWHPCFQQHALSHEILGIEPGLPPYWETTPPAENCPNFPNFMDLLVWKYIWLNSHLIFHVHLIDRPVFIFHTCTIKGSSWKKIFGEKDESLSRKRE